MCTIYLRSSALADMGDGLATIDTGRKVRGCCTFSVGVAGSHLTQCRLGRGRSPHQVASWSIQPFGRREYTNVTHKQTDTDRQTNRQTTSLRCCDNFIICRSRDEWISRLGVLYINRSFNGADVPVCRHSSCLQASSPSPLIFISSTRIRCSTDANHLRWQKLRCRRTAPVEQFAGYSKTYQQLRTV